MTRLAVGADGDGAFARIEGQESLAGAVATSWTKRFGEKCLPWTPPVYTRLRPVLDAGAAHWESGEIVLAELFLLLEADRAVAWKHLQSVLARPCQSFSWLPLFAECGVKTYLAPSKPGASHIFQGKDTLDCGRSRRKRQAASRASRTFRSR